MLTLLCVIRVGHTGRPFRSTGQLPDSCHREQSAAIPPSIGKIRRNFAIIWRRPSPALTLPDFAALPGNDGNEHWRATGGGASIPAKRCAHPLNDRLPVPPWARLLAAAGALAGDGRGAPRPAQGLRYVLRRSRSTFHGRSAPRDTPSEPPVVIVDIDERSLKQLGQWPWPRTLVAQLVDRLREAGAAVIARRAVQRARPDVAANAAGPVDGPGAGEEEAKRLLATMPDPDTELAEAMAKAPVVVGFSLAAAAARRKPRSRPVSRWSVRGAKTPGALSIDPPKRSALCRHSGKRRLGNGFVNEPSDWDNVVRHVPLVLRLGDKPVPSLAAEALRVAFGACGYCK